MRRSLSRFRTYLPDLAAYGDDGTAQAYVEPVRPAGHDRMGGRGAGEETGAGLSDPVIRQVESHLKTLLTAVPE